VIASWPSRESGELLRCLWLSASMCARARTTASDGCVARPRERAELRDRPGPG